MRIFVLEHIVEATKENFPWRLQCLETHQLYFWMSLPQGWTLKPGDSCGMLLTGYQL